MTSFSEEFHRQLQAAAANLSAAMSAEDDFLVEAARARLAELGDIARRHCGLDVPADRRFARTRAGNLGSEAISVRCQERSRDRVADTLTATVQRRSRVSEGSPRIVES